MKRSTDRILTTHTGSLARPDDLIEVMRAKEDGKPYDRDWFKRRAREAVIEAVRRQCECDIDVVNDGEQSKSGFSSYQAERLGGFEARPSPGRRTSRAKEVQHFPEYYERYFQTAMYGAMLGPPVTMVCTGPVTYVGREALQTDLDNLRAGLEGQTYEEVFVSAANPANLANQQNEYYANREEFLTALADAMREEYTAIMDAGYIIQMDDPAASSLWGLAELPEEERRKGTDARIEMINYALKGIPTEKIRYHTCYGINQGPHIFDLHLGDFIEPMLRVNAQAVSFEVMNPRHMHDYHVFETVKLPEGKIIIPGMLSHGANWVEHPELIAELTVNYANLVGRENLMIGNDCGFASQAAAREVDPRVAFAKLEALAEGARIASRKLWGRSA